MRLVSKMVLAALAVGLCSTSASAAVTLVGSTPLASHPGPAAGEIMVWDFDSIADSRFTYTGNVVANPGIPSVAAEPKVFAPGIFSA